MQITKTIKTIYNMGPSSGSQCYNNVSKRAKNSWVLIPLLPLTQCVPNTYLLFTDTEANGCRTPRDAVIINICKALPRWKELSTYLVLFINKGLPLPSYWLSTTFFASLLMWHITSALSNVASSCAWLIPKFASPDRLLEEDLYKWHSKSSPSNLHLRSLLLSN